MQKSADAFRTISEVADELSLPQHVLRFWETRFPQIRPLKRAGGRRYYRPADVLLLKTISQLLYDDGYTIKGVQRLLKEQGAKALSATTYADDLVDVPAGDGKEGGDGDPSLPPSDALEEDVAALLISENGTFLSDAHRDAIASALATVDECRRILDALSPAAAPSRCD